MPIYISLILQILQFLNINIIIKFRLLNQNIYTVNTKWWYNIIYSNKKKLIN